MTDQGGLLFDHLGLPAELGRATTAQIHSDLHLLWRQTFSRDIGELPRDLEDMRVIFDPVASGRRLRERLLALPPTQTPNQTILIPAPCIVRVDDQHALITPEGRIAIELLGKALRDPADPVRIDLVLAADMLGELLVQYRTWGRHRLESVLRLLSGGKALQIPAIGGVLTLLVNRSDKPERAIERVPEGPARDSIDAAFRAPASAFANVVAPSDRRAADKERLISGWTLHEVNRRLPGALTIQDEQIYVTPDRKSDLVRFVASELARPRRHADESTVTTGFTALVDAYRSKADVLAGFGMAHERPSDTRTLQAELLTEFSAARQ